MHRTALGAHTAAEAAVVPAAAAEPAESGSARGAAAPCFCPVSQLPDAAGVASRVQSLVCFLFSTQGFNFLASNRW